MNERLTYINALLHQDDPAKEMEIRQLLLDLMDITEQTPLGYCVCAAYTAFTEHAKQKR